MTTLFGRIRRVPELRSRQFQTRSLGERLAVNMVIQGTAADIIKLAMVRARDELRAAGLDDPARAPDPRRAAVRGARRTRWSAASEIIEREMASAFEMDPPLEVDVRRRAGTGWRRSEQGARRPPDGRGRRARRRPGAGEQRRARRRSARSAP